MKRYPILALLALATIGAPSNTDAGEGHRRSNGKRIELKMVNQ